MDNWKRRDVICYCDLWDYGQREHCSCEQKVARLQEQLQAERDLRAALEVGLSMSSGQFSGSRSMYSKTRAKLEEIALAEADVARLKQKVAELHHQLNQQSQHHYGTLSYTSDRYQRATNTSAHQLYIQRLEIAKNDLRQRMKKRQEEMPFCNPAWSEGSKRS